MDTDGDGYGSPGSADCESGSEDDCDDSDADVNPGVEEICNDQDDDCDGTVDEDTDGDGSGVCSDCEEGDPTLYPGAPASLGGLTYSYICSGAFEMGAPDSEVGNDFTGELYSETQHWVTISTPFYIGATEITQLDFSAMMNDWNPSNCEYGCGDDVPVHDVNWYELAAYANERSQHEYLAPCYEFTNVVCESGAHVGSTYMDCFEESNEQFGLLSAVVSLASGIAEPFDCEGYRLPTESEWEYAARGGLMGQSFPSGGNLLPGTEYIEDSDVQLDDGSMLGDQTWFKGVADGEAHAVAELDPNGYSLWDMSGNVFEFCQDWIGDTYEHGDQVEDPWGPTTGDCRVGRGGAFFRTPASSRVANRNCWNPDLRNQYVGGRLARSAFP